MPGAMRFETRNAIISKSEGGPWNGGKSWATIAVQKGVPEWRPAFEEHFYLAHIIAICEEELKYIKYGGNAKVKGADLVADFLEETAKSIRGTKGSLTQSQIVALWDSIATRLKIPKRHLKLPQSPVPPPPA